jgi:hypothetical protein
MRSRRRPRRLRRCISERSPPSSSSPSPFALAPVRPALAALAEELSEVTRLHHAGQSQAALERADRFLAGKPKDAQMRFLKSVVLADSGRRSEAAALSAADLSGLSRAGRAAQQPRRDPCRRRRLRQGPRRAGRIDPPQSRLCTAHENLGDVHAMLAAEAYGRAQRLEPRSTSPAEEARAREAARRAAGGPGRGERPGARPSPILPPRNADLETPMQDLFTAP